MENVGVLYFTVIWYIYFMAIWYALWSFGIFFPVLVCCIEIIWQPCMLHGRVSILYRIGQSGIQPLENEFVAAQFMKTKAK
jgi:hypothetical protein